jgi:hypothetical protein
MPKRKRPGAAATAPRPKGKPDLADQSPITAPARATQVPPTDGLLPRRGRGRPSAAAAEAWNEQVTAFCATILEIRSRLDFDVGSRDWAYLLEGDRFINKDEMDAAQKLINDCRKSGDLPLDICAEDDKRAAENLEYIDPDPQERAADIFDDVRTAQDDYTPFSFWDDLDVYVQMAVEKSSLKSLFSPTCAEFCIPISNIGGWADLNVRAGFMRRFKEKEAEGKQPVLLDCTDFDPGGLQISDFLRSNFEDMAHAVEWSPDNLIIDRFGLNYDFIEREGLTWIDNLITSKGEYPLDDRRHPDHYKPYVQTYLRKYGVRKVEANALVKRPEAGRKLCRQAILKYVPADAPRRYLKKLKPFRAALRREIGRLLAEGASS